MPGTLYVVATPVGNLGDITYRAVDVMKRAAVIACEDTRHTRKLLDHYAIRTPTLSCHEHNEAARVAELVARLLDGADVAVVADAGTPLVSDPGYRLVEGALAAGIHVVPVPGPSAVIAALSAAGLPTHDFRFLGFLPAKPASRRKALAAISQDSATVVFFEAPHRILGALDDIAAVLGDRRLVVAREMTKLHEEFLRGTAAEIRAALASRPAVQGEMTIVVSGAANRAPPAGEEEIRAAVAELERGGRSRMEAIKEAARRFGLPKREIYRIAVSPSRGRAGRPR
jgi:16S rRNA (cytidine1402-2'-O)-methyltransferase